MPMHSRSGWRRFRIWDRLGQHPLSLGVTYAVAGTVDDTTKENTLGLNVVYTITITNNGSGEDIFDIAKSGESWTTVLSDSTKTIAGNGGTEDITATVTIPYSADVGDTDAVTVTVTSQGDPTISAGVALTSTAELLSGITPYAWFRADKITGLNDGDLVSQWDDESGNGRHVAQSVSGSKPTYKTNILNSLPIVRFDGDILEKADVTAVGNAKTVFAVALTTVFNTWKSVVLVEDAGNQRNMQLLISSAAEGNMGFSTGPGAWVNQASVDTFQASTYHLVHGYYDGSSALMGALDADERSSTPGGTPEACTNYLVVGGSHYDGANAWAGDIVEVLVFDELLSDANRTKIKNYLNGKYAL